MNCSLSHLLFDEIALEGLEGITLDGLWLRLQARNDFVQKETGKRCLPDLNDFLKNKIFELILNETEKNNLQFYQLETSRRPLIIFDRHEYFKYDTSTFFYGEKLPDNIYNPITLIREKDIFGSCSEYDQRKDCSEAVLKSCKTVDDLTEIYPDLNSLVIVASQKLRAIALFGEKNWEEYINSRIESYCMLEYIARNRSFGYLNSTFEAIKYPDNRRYKSYYYDKNFLVEKGLVLQYAISYVESSKGRCMGSLLFLARFKPKYISSVDSNLLRCVQLFHDRNTSELDLDDLRQAYISSFDEPKDKVLKFNKKKMVTLLARFPHAFVLDEEASKVKSLLPLFRPPHGTDFYINTIISNDNSSESKDIGFDPMIGDDISAIKRTRIESKIFKKDYINRIYKIIESYEDIGCSRQQLCRHADLPMKLVRGIIKNIQERNLIFKRIQLVSKNNVHMFVSKKFENIEISEEREYYQKIMGEFVSEDTQRRIEFILKYIKTKGFISELFWLQKAMRTSEMKAALLDVRTLIGMLNKLYDSKLINIRVFSMSWKNTLRQLTIYSDKEYPMDTGALVQKIDGKLIVCDIIEQILLCNKFLAFHNLPVEFNDIQTSVSKECIDSQKFDPDDIGIESKENQAFPPVETMIASKVVNPKRTSKVERIFTLYKFIHYLLVPQQLSHLDSYETQNWHENIPRLYKIFPDRSCKLLDVLLYMPIHMIRSIAGIQNDVPELYEYWNDPVKKYLTLHRIPAPVRLFLLQNRKIHFKLTELLDIGSQVGLFAVARNKPSQSAETLLLTLNTELHMTVAFNDDSPYDYSFESIQDFNKFVLDVENHVSSQHSCSNDKCSIFPDLNIHSTLFHGNLRASKRAMEDMEAIHAKKKRKKGEKRKKATVENDIPKKVKKVKKTPKESSSWQEIEENDEKPKKGLKRKIERQRRQTWNRLEDQFLLQCRLVTLVMEPNCANQTIIPRGLVMSLLHEQLPSSLNKEGNSMAKRMAKLIQIPSVKKTLTYALNELDFIDPEMLDCQASVTDSVRDAKFKHILNIVQNFQFKSTDFFLSKNQREQRMFVKKDVYSQDSLPNTMEEFKKSFVIITVDDEIKDTFFKEPNNFIDIHGYVISNILLSSLISIDLNASSKIPATNKNSFIKAVKRALKYFPESVVAVVFRKMLMLGMVKKIRTKQRNIRIPWIYYRLSNGYSDRLQQYHIPYAVVNNPESVGDEENYSAYNIWQFAETLSSNVLGLSEEFESKFRTEIPEEFFQFNSKGNDHKETSFRSLISRQLNETNQKNSDETIKEGKDLNDFLIKHIKVKIEKTVLNDISDDESHQQVISQLKRRSRTFEATSMQEFSQSKFDEDIQKVKTFLPKRIVDTIVNKLEASGELGVKENSFMEMIKSEPEVTKQKLEGFFQACEDRELIFEAGICERTWTHRKFFQHWVIHYKVLQQSPVVIGESIGDASPTKIFNSRVYLPKLWKLSDGRTDINSLFAFFNLILGHLTFEHTCLFVSIREKFSELIPGAQLQELLNYLTILGCVKRIRAPIKRGGGSGKQQSAKRKIDSFCDYFNQEYDLSDEDDDEELEDDSISEQSSGGDFGYDTFYEAVLNSTTKLASFYQSAIKENFD